MSLSVYSKPKGTYDHLAQHEKRLRLVELLLVLAVAFSGSLVLSLYAVLTGKPLYSPAGNLLPQAFNAIVQEAGAIAVLVYVLFRQGRRLRDIGLTVSWKDVPRSLWVGLGGVSVYWGLGVLLRGSYYAATGNALTSRPANVEFLRDAATGWHWPIMLLYALLNPFCEELIVRAYLMTEVWTLTGQWGLAVLVSVLLQSCYHLYQGIIPACLYGGLFLVYSLYFAKTKRIFPVILAHMYLDVLALLNH